MSPPRPGCGHSGDGMDSLLLRILPEAPPPALLRYGAASALILATALLRYVIDPTLRPFPFLLFFPEMLLCMLFFGRGPAYLAVALSMASVTALHLEILGTSSLSPDRIVGIAIFGLVGLLIVELTGALTRALAKVRAADREKALLFDELVHRTKNDLATISAAIHMQQRAATSEETRNALAAANGRVAVIAAAQGQLRMTGDAGQVELKPYIEALCRGFDEIVAGLRPITISVACEAIAVPMAVAVTLGLIINELVINSLKYAFPNGSAGSVAISVSRHGGGLRVIVADDGVGYPPEAKPGMGSRLVDLLARQKSGLVTRDPVGKGCRVVVDLNDARVA